MIFDLSLLTALQPLLFILSFAGVFAALKIIVRFLPATRYAGSVLIGSILIINFFLLEPPLFLGLLVSSIIILLVGTLDEVYKLSAAKQLVAQVAVAATAVTGGWAIHYISNPLAGGVFELKLGWLATIIWLVFLINTINWSDGLDGLAGGLGTVAFFVIAAITLLPAIQDELTLNLALVGAGAFLGFLIWNWSPARVYLGTSGSWFLGLYLGLAAIIGGGKIATTLLVLAIPALDTFFVIIQRLLDKRAPWTGDKTRHLHHRLLRLGFSPAAITALAIVAATIFGVAAVVLQTQQKLMLLFAIGIVFALAATSMRIALK